MYLINILHINIWFYLFISSAVSQSRVNEDSKYIINVLNQNKKYNSHLSITNYCPADDILTSLCREDLKSEVESVTP